MNGRRVLVTGATGAVGPTVLRALKEAGWSPRVLAQPGSENVLRELDVEARTGDIADPSALGPAMEGISTVVHMAALLHETGSRSPASEYERVNVQGTVATLAAARRAGVSRLVLMSTIAVYGELGGAVADEGTEPRPDTPYARTKLAAEQLALAATHVDGRPLAAVLRAGAVYGPRVKGNYRRLVIALRRRRFVPVGAGCNRRTVVFDGDLARAIVLGLEHPRAAGAVFNVSDGGLHPVRAVVGAICEALGRRPPRLYVPLGLALFACRLAESAAGIAGLEPIVREESLRKYVEDVAVSSERIRRELGFAANYDLLSGWRATVDGLRAAGEL